MNWRKAAFAALLAVLVGVSVLPLTASPLIREFPKPFVQDGTIDYDGDGVPDIAIIIGGQKPGLAAAAEDVRGATLIGTKIGSHLYYTKAPNTKGTDYWIEELTADVWHYTYKRWSWGGSNADEGLWFRFGDGVTYPPFSNTYPNQFAYPLDTDTFAPDYLLVATEYVNETIEEVPICPGCPNFGVNKCEAPVLVYSVGYALTGDDKKTLGDNVLFADLMENGGATWIITGYDPADYPGYAGPLGGAVYVYYNDGFNSTAGSGSTIGAEDIFSGKTQNYTLNKPGFAMLFSTTPVGTAILEEGKEYYVPFLGYWIEVDDITPENASFIVRESEGGPIKTMLNLEYSTDSEGNVNKLFIYLNDLAENRLEGAGYNMVFFLYIYRIDTDDDYMEVMLSSPWIDKHIFERIDLDDDGVVDITDLEYSWPADAPVSAFDWWIEEGYFVGYVIINGSDMGPFSVKMDPWDKLPYDHIYGIVSYTYPGDDSIYWYVIPENGTWHLGEKKTYGSNEFIFDNKEVFEAYDDGTADCGSPDCLARSDFGVFLYDEGNVDIETEVCKWTDALTYLMVNEAYEINQTLDDFTYGVDSAVALYELHEIFPINVTGVFAGVYDRFENITGNWTGTTLLDEYYRDITPASEKNQIFELEDVFSFVKAPLVWLDYQFLDENYQLADKAEEAGLPNKNLILVGGPVVNRVVDYLNDSGLLWIVYVGDRLYDTRFTLVTSKNQIKNGSFGDIVVGGQIQEDGYLDLSKVSIMVGAPTASFIGGLGVIQYAKDDPWGEEMGYKENYILVVAGNNRYGTYAAAVTLADPTKIVRVPTDIPMTYYLAGNDTEYKVEPNQIVAPEHPPAVIVVALLPGYKMAMGYSPPTRYNIVEITWPTPVTFEPVFTPAGG